MMDFKIKKKTRSDTKKAKTTFSFVVAVHENRLRLIKSSTKSKTIQASTKVLFSWDMVIVRWNRLKQITEQTMWRVAQPMKLYKLSLFEMHIFFFVDFRLILVAFLLRFSVFIFQFSKMNFVGVKNEKEICLLSKVKSFVSLLRASHRIHNRIVTTVWLRKKITLKSLEKQTISVDYTFHTFYFLFHFVYGSHSKTALLETLILCVAKAYDTNRNLTFDTVRHIINPKPIRGQSICVFAMNTQIAIDDDNTLTAASTHRATLLFSVKRS